MGLEIWFKIQHWWWLSSDCIWYLTTKVTNEPRKIFEKWSIFNSKVCRRRMWFCVPLWPSKTSRRTTKWFFFLSQNIIFIWRSTKNIFQQKIIKINSFEHLQNDVFKTSYKAPQWKRTWSLKANKKLKRPNPYACRIYKRPRQAFSFAILYLKRKTNNSPG